MNHSVSAASDSAVPAAGELSPIISVADLIGMTKATTEAGSGNGRDVVIVDCRAYLDDREGSDAYDAGHIPDARFVDLDTVLSSTPTPEAGRHPLPTAEAFAAGMAAAGISHTSTVVAYDDASGMIAGRLVWMLRIFGQPAAILDGGIQAWDGELTTTVSTFDVVEHTARPWPEGAMADADAVEASIAAGGLVIDSRGAPRYRGETEPIDPIAGHVPGAVNLPFSENLSGEGVAGKFHPVKALRERFSERGVDKDTIYYCGSGVSACHNMLAAEAAGFDRGKLYVGSWSGWSGSGRPHEVGD